MNEAIDRTQAAADLEGSHGDLSAVESGGALVEEPLKPRKRVRVSDRRLAGVAAGLTFFLGAAHPEWTSHAALLKLLLALGQVSLGTRRGSSEAHDSRVIAELQRNRGVIANSYGVEPPGDSPAVRFLDRAGRSPRGLHQAVRGDPPRTACLAHAHLVTTRPLR